MTQEIFNLFRNQVDVWSSSLDPDVEDDVWEAMTHALKGSARAVGAMKMAKICEDAETLIGDGNRPGARDVFIGRIENAISQVTIEIQRWEYRQTLEEIRQLKPGK